MQRKVKFNEDVKVVKKTEIIYEKDEKGRRVMILDENGKQKKKLHYKTIYKKGQVITASSNSIDTYIQKGICTLITTFVKRSYMVPKEWTDKETEVVLVEKKKPAPEKNKKTGPTKNK